MAPHPASPGQPHTPAARVLGSLTAHPFVAGLGTLALVSLFFLLLPEVDLAVSALFFDPATGFLHERYEALYEIRSAGRLVEILLLLAVLVPVLLKLLLPHRPILVRPRATVFAVASLIVGPGLLVNSLLKEHWGRARPRQLLQFGGDSSFSPVWWISDQCQRNCSFVSGEASAAFWVLAAAFIVPKPFRPLAAGLAVAFAAIVSATRVAMGGHFVSDVLIAWLVTLLVMLLFQRLILRGLPAGFDPAVERALAWPMQAVKRRLALHRPPPAL